MTSNQSLFNKGIFKLTLKRFKWGSVLYFFLLFMTTCFPVLTETNSEWKMIYDSPYKTTPFLFDDGLPIFFIVMAIAVPTIVSLLIFRVIHSDKQTVFMHSIPVTRKSQFISSMLGGMALMAIPVILNGIVLMILRINYTSILRIQHCLIWIAINLIILFVMFSIATLACVLTGNSFMAIFLYGAIQLLPLGIYAVISCIGNIFVFGYYENAAIPDFILKYTPITWFSTNIFKMPNAFFENIFTIIIYLILAIIIYISSSLIYNIRKSERAGDITSFKCLNPILKYTLTFMATVFMIYITVSFDISNLLIMILFTILISAVVYFICEMVLKKSFRVFGSYKGFLGYSVIFVFVIGIISLTGFFGYRSYIPKDIKGVSFHSKYNAYYENNGYTENLDAIKYVTDIHKDILNDKTYICSDKYIPYTTAIIIEYTKPNGKIVKRSYRIKDEKYYNCIGTLYDNYEDFKTSYNPLLSGKYDATDIITINYNNGVYFYSNIVLKKDIETFLNLYTSEAKSLNYEDIYHYDAENLTIEIKNEPYSYYLNLPISMKFEKTYEFLEEAAQYEEE